MRARAAGLVTAELGYRSERDIDLSLKRDVEAERWTSLDHRLQSIADNNGGMIDLRSDPNHHGSRFDKHLPGRAMKMERPGLAARTAPGTSEPAPGRGTAMPRPGCPGALHKNQHTP